jgi:hypothetical protein
VRCEGRGGMRVGECECHTPKRMWRSKAYEWKGGGALNQLLNIY